MCCSKNAFHVSQLQIQIDICNSPVCPSLLVMGHVGKGSVQAVIAPMSQSDRFMFLRQPWITSEPCLNSLETPATLEPATLQMESSGTIYITDLSDTSDANLFADL